jgi:hypothetical protein
LTVPQQAGRQKVEKPYSALVLSELRREPVPGATDGKDAE